MANRRNGLEGAVGSVAAAEPAATTHLGDSSVQTPPAGAERQMGMGQNSPCMDRSHPCLAPPPSSHDTRAPPGKRSPVTALVAPLSRPTLHHSQPLEPSADAPALTTAAAAREPKLTVPLATAWRGLPPHGHEAVATVRQYTRASPCHATTHRLLLAFAQGQAPLAPRLARVHRVWMGDTRLTRK